MTASQRPIPVPDANSAGHWEAAARHVFALARCPDCQRFSHPPDGICASCGAINPAFEFVPLSGNGRVRSWTVIRQALLPGFDRLVPYVLVDVELAEQADLRVIGRLLDGPEAEVTIGDAVKVEFDDVAEGVSIPEFRLVRA
ncbi:Zn-ribbon domain-containing OB-fold protein [Novosphingobium bradum]|uniref:Zn-ribbon domain-containing OB-fold protein n=1 Tax=Novosphingobium bradum TaxID=1737444 RepID=A0ABV7IWQ7_9SPHN